MYHYGSPLLKRFKASELNSAPKETIRKGRFYTFLFFSGLAVLLAIPLYKGFVNWQDSVSSVDENVSQGEVISIKGEDGALGKNVDDNGPIKLDPHLTSGHLVEKDKLPTLIIIPSLSIDLPVTPSKVIDGYWELSEDSASFGLGSAPPGEAGNTVIFAHARQGLFLPLRKIKKDATIYVFTKNNWYSYKVEDIKLVKPNQTEVVAPTSDETLTLYTCSGFADTKRLIIKAKRT